MPRAEQTLDRCVRVFESGHAFDGSSIAGWKGIQASDMLLMPDPATANIDPFMDETTLLLTCDVIEPAETRPRLIKALRMLSTKREAVPARKHGNIPL